MSLPLKEGNTVCEAAEEEEEEEEENIPVTVEPAVTGHLDETAEVPALQARSVEVTSVTGELDVG